VPYPSGGAANQQDDQRRYPRDPRAGDPRAGRTRQNDPCAVLWRVANEAESVTAAPRDYFAPLAE
jgi:hypothetical protein